MNYKDIKVGDIFKNLHDCSFIVTSIDDGEIHLMNEMGGTLSFFNEHEWIGLAEMDFKFRFIKNNKKLLSLLERLFENMELV